MSQSSTQEYGFVCGQPTKHEHASQMTAVLEQLIKSLAAFAK